MQLSLTPLLLQAVMPQASSRSVTRFLPALTTAMAHYSIAGTLRTAHFLAQVAHESGQLAFTEELASGAAYEGRADLGNVEPGDGMRFKGRGLLQITGRANYTAYSKACGQDLLSGSNPSRLATDAVLATDVAGWFWHVHGLNALADADDVVHITRRINGGINGLVQRKAFLLSAKAALQHAVTLQAATAKIAPSFVVKQAPAAPGLPAAEQAPATAPASAAMAKAEARPAEAPGITIKAQAEAAIPRMCAMAVSWPAPPSCRELAARSRSTPHQCRQGLRPISAANHDRGKSTRPRGTAAL